MKFLPRLLLLLVVLPMACGDRAGAGDPDLSAAIADGWHYVSHTPVRARSGRVSFSRADLDSALAAGHAAPLFVMTRGSGNSVETVGINLRRLAPGEVVAPAALLAELSAGAAHLQLQQPASDTVLDGRHAARALFVDDNAGEFPVTIAVADDLVFTIAASMPPATAARQRHRDFTASIKFNGSKP